MSPKWEAKRQLVDSTKVLSALIKAKNAFSEKIVKKQPDLVTETAFDEKRRPKNVLGTVTPK